MYIAIFFNDMNILHYLIYLTYIAVRIIGVGSYETLGGTGFQGSGGYGMLTLKLTKP